MLSKDFDSLLKTKHEEEEKLLASKGLEYTISDYDRFPVRKRVSYI